MRKRSKAYSQSKEKVQPQEYNVADAVGLLKDMVATKFDQSVDMSIRLGVDPKYPEQMVRGTVVLPHGTGKTTRVLVIAAGEKQKEAEEAGADFVGGEEMVEKIQTENWTDFDMLVSTPDMMKQVGKLGKVLGPKGLMPSPKAGTVTFEVKNAVSEIKKGRVEFKVDKAGIINSSVAKLSFDPIKISDNIKEFVKAVLKAKPVALKGKYVKSVFISATMSPSVRINMVEFEK